MKIIDKTPLQDENGKIGFLQRIQGTLQFGLNWYPELEGQKRVIVQLERNLKKGYTLIRNYTLGASGIVLPIALIGPAGIFVVHVTTLRGDYQAKGDAWETMQNGRFTPTAINLLTRTQRLARALQVFIERQGLQLPVQIEPVILAADPGLQVESVRPLVRVVMSDAIDRWAASIAQAPPQLTVEAAHQITERIINPQPAKSQETPAPAPELESEPYEQGEDNQNQSRAFAIFNSEEDTSSLDADGLDFTFDESIENEADVPEELRETSPSQMLPAKLASGRFLGMSFPQWALLGGLGLVEICILIGFAYLIFSTP